MNQGLVKVLINGHAVVVNRKQTILEAAKKAGIAIPTLCYHPSVEKPRAVCRMCLVEVKGGKKPVPACYTEVEEGMEVSTQTKELREFRKHDLEFFLARHPNDCMKCEVAGSCKLQNLVQEEQLFEKWPKVERGDREHHPEHVLKDHTHPSIDRDMSKCIECGLCVNACSKQGLNCIGFVERGWGIVPMTVFDKPLKETKCISCGQCTAVCPVGALTERPDWHRVLKVLDARDKTTVVQTAPASRIAIGEEFGFAPGEISTGRLVNALRHVGFDYVFDTNFSADLTIMEEANELVQRVKGKREGKLPLFTSCCPGWISYVEIERPDLIPHLSTTKSPQQMHAAMTKHGPFAKGKKREDIFVVSVMPCTAKKDEAVRPGMRGDVDAVLTTRELARLLRHRNVPFPSLPNDGVYDSALGESTGAGMIFGASGGVLEAALRTATHILGLENAPIDFKQVRGVAMAGIKVAEVPNLGKVAAVNSMSAAIELLKNEDWRKEFIMIEVMSCLGGCLGGGGEPKSDDPDVLEKRAKGVYQIDATSTKRKSFQNEEVQALYNQFLKYPLSEKSEEYLHTTFAPRGSPREFLARFLDAVDHHDGRVAAELFAEDGEWNTNSSFGTIKGKQNIEYFITHKLPKLSGKHRLAPTGTSVKTPTGEHVHFQIDLTDAKIKMLTRQIL